MRSIRIKKYQITQEDWKEILQNRSKYFIRLTDNQVYNVDFQMLPDSSFREWTCRFSKPGSLITRKVPSTSIIEVLDKSTHPEYFL